MPGNKIGTYHGRNSEVQFNFWW